MPLKKNGQGVIRLGGSTDRGAQGIQAADKLAGMVMAPPERLLMSAEEMQGCLDRLAGEICARHGADSQRPAIVGIRRRGVYLAARLRDILRSRLGEDIPEGILDINLYRDDWSTLGHRAAIGSTVLDFDVGGRVILLVDDVLYTGRTVRAALEAMADYGRPRAVELLVLVDRGGRELPIQADYAGKVISVGRDERVDVLLNELDGQDRVILRKNRDFHFSNDKGS